MGDDLKTGDSKPRGRRLGAEDLTSIVGSGLLWAWFDALFMGAFYAGTPAPQLMAEGAAMAMDGFSVLFFALVLVRGTLVRRLLAKRPFLVVAGALGTVGSALFVCSGWQLSWPLLLAGGLLGGAFAAVCQMGWGATYCERGSRTALVRVSGAFACAVVLDFPLLFMVPMARAVFLSLFPLISAVILTHARSEVLSYPRPARDISARAAGLRTKLSIYLGLSVLIMVGLMLGMLGFGYIQHLVSFSSPAHGGLPWGVLVQVVRGIAALLMFAGVLFAPRVMGVVYRVGLLVMVAGFMANSFLLDTDFLWVSGAIVITGYTVFDVMVWVVVSQVAYTQSKSPAKTIACIRLLAGACYVLGAAAGIALTGTQGARSPFVVQESNAVGYLVVVAVVFLMSSEDIRVLFNAFRRRPTIGSDELPDAEGPSPSEDDADCAGSRPDEGLLPSEARMQARLDDLGLTARERDVAEPLACGRTQPWIAEALGISSNTVGTHMRHIYQKAEVHNRQEFIDVLTGRGGAPETR